MTWEWWAALFAGPVGYLAKWRLPYLACYGYGLLLASHQRIKVSRQAAYEMGREAILGGAADGVMAAWRAIDWKKVAAGLAYWRKEMREAFADVGRGARRDWLRFRAWASGWGVQHRVEPVVPEETRQRIALLNEYAPQIGETKEASVAAAGVLFDLERERATTVGRLLDQSIESPYSDVLRHTAVTEALNEHYRKNPADAFVMATPQGLMAEPPRLLGAVGAGLSFKATLAAGVAALAFLGLWRLEVAHSDKLEADNAQLQANESAYATAIKQRDDALAQRDAAIKQRTTNYLNEIDRANGEAMKARQAAAAERKRRLDQDKATLAGGGDVPLGDLLRAYPAARDDSGGPVGSGAPSP